MAIIEPGISAMAIRPDISLLIANIMDTIGAADIAMTLMKVWKPRRYGKYGKTIKAFLNLSKAIRLTSLVSVDTSAIF